MTEETSNEHLGQLEFLPDVAELLEFGAQCPDTMALGISRLENGDKIYRGGREQ